ncbi:MAG: synthase [Edaphobacter sp.]|nr:synthase [Edaphobacter sp.]
MIPVLGIVNVSRPDARSSQSHRAEGTASAQPATMPLPLLVLPPHPQRLVISTEAAHAFVRSAVEKSASSTHPVPQPQHLRLLVLILRLSCRCLSPLPLPLVVIHPPFFLGYQFHPEFKSKPLEPHPIFRDFIATSCQNHLRITATAEPESQFKRNLWNLVRRVKRPPTVTFWGPATSTTNTC